MADLKVVDFKKTSSPEEPVRLPNAEEIESLTMGKPLKRVVLAVVNEDGVFATYVDGANVHEAVGMLEDMKWGLVAQARVDGAIDIDD